MHADFGSGLYDGGPIGIPYVTVRRAASARVPVSFDYADESDRGRYPIPPRRADRGRARLRRRPPRDRGGPLALPALRAVRAPTRCDGGGALARRLGRDLEPALEPAAPARLDLRRRRRAADPARARALRRGAAAAASTTPCASPRRARGGRSSTRRATSRPTLTDPDLPAMGQRLRLRRGFDISRFPRQSRIVLRALKRYGMILADNGSPWYVCGAPNRGWDNDDLHSLHGVPGSAFEVVDTLPFAPPQAVDFEACGRSGSAARAGSTTSWRGASIRRGSAKGRWLERYAEVFDTVEVNSTFYRLASRDAVARWVEQTPPDFVFAAKASRYMTHVRRLQNLAEGIGRYYERIEPLVESGKLGPIVWQFPANFKRDDDRARRRATAAAARAPLLRVPPRELVHGAGLQAAAGPRRGARDRRPPALALPGARADRRLDARPPPPRPPRPARQLLGDGAGRVGPADRRVAPPGRGVRLLQQRLGGLRGRQRALAQAAAAAVSRRFSARRRSRDTCICE